MCLLNSSQDAVEHLNLKKRGFKPRLGDVAGINCQALPCAAGSWSVGWRRRGGDLERGGNDSRGTYPHDTRASLFFRVASAKEDDLASAPRSCHVSGSVDASDCPPGVNGDPGSGDSAVEEASAASAASAAPAVGSVRMRTTTRSTLNTINPPRAEPSHVRRC